MVLLHIIKGGKAQFYSMLLQWLSCDIDCFGSKYDVKQREAAAVELRKLWNTQDPQGTGVVEDEPSMHHRQ